MCEKYLIINAGSSSLKFTLYDASDNTEIVKGNVEKIGEKGSFYTLKYDGKKEETAKEVNNHTEAIEIVLEELLRNNFIKDVNEIKGVGHRVLHGGEKYSDSVIITDEVIDDIIYLTKLGPLHHPGNIAGIKAIEKAMPNVLQVAVFDTAFHQSIEEENYIYPVPYSWYKENNVRKYGFHGTSHKYITEVIQQSFAREDVNLIICHIGSGCSMSAIKNGKCCNTTMGLTPLDGLMMGTRSGAIDPSILEYICKERNLTIEEATNILNKESGLKGICGVNDFREVTALAEQGDYKAKLALALFKKSIIKYIAQYYFELNGNVDAIIFTAGVGENMASFREDIVNYISDPLGIKIDKKANDNIAKFKKYQSGVITTDDSRIKVMVIPTNEEYMILKDTVELCNKYKEEKSKQLIKK